MTKSDEIVKKYNKNSVEIIKAYVQDILPHEETYFYISNKIISDLIRLIVHKGAEKGTGFDECENGFDLMGKIFVPLLTEYVSDITRIHAICNTVRDDLEKHPLAETKKMVASAKDIIDDFFKKASQLDDYLKIITLGVVLTQMNQVFNRHTDEEVTPHKTFVLLKKALEESVEIVENKIAQHATCNHNTH